MHSGGSTLRYASPIESSTENQYSTLLWNLDIGFASDENGINLIAGPPCSDPFRPLSASPKSFPIVSSDISPTSGIQNLMMVALYTIQLYNWKIN